MTGLDLMQIQIEAIDAADNEGSIDPAAFAEILLLDPEPVAETNTSLVEKGVMERDAEGSARSDREWRDGP
ncbi:MAG: hypothetical protein JST08_00440 [Actinobacteria bacterium]|nr:hypothetical protein [Actinomycetota bacterium]